MGKMRMGRSRPFGSGLVFPALWIVGMAVALVLMASIAVELMRGTPVSTGLLSGAPSVSAQSAVVMDLTSGRILYEKNKR